MPRVNLDEIVRSYWKWNNVKDAILTIGLLILPMFINITDIIRYN